MNKMRADVQARLACVFLCRIFHSSEFNRSEEFFVIKEIRRDENRKERG